MKIFQSASKIVFLLISIGATAMTLMGIIDAKDYMILASMAFSYYFTKAVPSNSSIV